jgi:hypothetical protein
MIELRDSAELPRRVEQHTNDEREERGTFNECGRDDHRCLDITGCFWLTRHAFDSLTADAANTEASAEDYEASADCGAQVHRAAWGRDARCRRGCSGLRHCRRGHEQQYTANCCQSNYVTHCFVSLKNPVKTNG